MLWKDVQRSAFFRVILMLPCWYGSAAGGEQGMPRFNLSEETTNKHGKCSVTVERVTNLVQCPFQFSGCYN